MNTIFKYAVIAFLQKKHDNVYDQFNQAFGLYRQSENKNFGAEASYNRAGYSESGLKNLLYDLQKVNNITDTELANKIEAIAEDAVKKIDVPVFSIVGDKKEETVSEDEKPLRDEFPFLNNENCPAEMYVVVGKRISLHKSYQKLHAELQAANKENTLDDAQILELTAKVEASYNENQALWKELNYFKENGKVLGDHPVLFEMRAKKEVDAMTTEQLVKYRQSSATYFSKKKIELEKAVKDEAKTEKINKGIALRNYQLDLVNSKLNMSGK